MSGKIRVLIVEDSALERFLLCEILSQEPDIEVVDVAPDADRARNKMRIHKPDVLTLDVKMPGEDGIAFLTGLMSTDPLPVIMVSAFTQAGAKTTLSALEKGAVDFVAKPDGSKDEDLEVFRRELIRKVRAAATAHMGRHPRPVPTHAPAELPETPGFIVAIGTSMGGPEALRSLLPRLPANFPAILLVQHMPEYFTQAMAESLDKICAIHVKEAEQGEPVLPGQALIAPGNCHMELRRLGTRYYVEIHKNPRVRGFRPSVDVLFESVAPPIRGFGHHRGHPDGDGLGWGEGHLPDEGRRRVHHCPGRGKLCHLRHAQTGHRDGGRRYRASSRGNPRPSH